MFESTPKSGYSFEEVELDEEAVQNYLRQKKILQHQKKLIEQKQNLEKEKRMRQNSNNTMPFTSTPNHIHEDESQLYATSANYQFDENHVRFFSNFLI